VVNGWRRVSRSGGGGSSSHEKISEGLLHWNYYSSVLALQPLFIWTHCKIFAGKDATLLYWICSLRKAVCLQFINQRFWKKCMVLRKPTIYEWVNGTTNEYLPFVRLFCTLLFMTIFSYVLTFPFSLATNELHDNISFNPHPVDSPTNPISAIEYSHKLPPNHIGLEA